MQLRQSTQLNMHRQFLRWHDIPIESSLSNLQRYLLRNLCTHALIIGHLDPIQILLQRLDFLDEYEQRYGLSQLSYLWTIIAPDETGDAYENEFQSIWSRPPTTISTRHIIVLLALFSQMGWHQQLGKHYQSSIDWIEPHKIRFKYAYKLFQFRLSIYKVKYGNAQEGVDEFQSHLANSTNPADQIFHRFSQTLLQPKSPEKFESIQSLLRELRTLPPNTTNRFRTERVLISAAFETLEEKLEALKELEAIIPFQNHPPNVCQTEIDGMYFDLFLEAKRYEDALTFGHKVLAEDTEMTLGDRQILQIKINRCKLHLRPIETSIDDFEHHQSAPSPNNDLKIHEAWDQYVEDLATLALRHYSDNPNLTEQMRWLRTLIDVKEKALAKSRQLAEQFNFTVSAKKIQQLGLRLYQLGVMYDKVKNTDQALEAFQQSSILFEEIQGPKRTLYAKQWANVLWKVHHRTETPENIAGLEKCLEIRDHLHRNGTIGLQYVLVLVRNTLGTWALRREEWSTAKEQHIECKQLIESLLQDFPDKQVYLAAEHKINVRLAWSLLHLGEIEAAQELASIFSNNIPITSDNCMHIIQAALDKL